MIQTESSDTEMKVYRASSEINRNDIKMRALGRKQNGLGLKQMKLSIVGICVLATLVQCIGATGKFTADLPISFDLLPSFQLILTRPNQIAKKKLEVIV